jgi:peptidoglycan/LPS O-acetylase OafA/YrhL
LLPSGVIGVPEPESAAAYVMTPITRFPKENKPMPHRAEAKNSDIEVMRALAIILAVIHHLNNLLIWDGAWKGLYKYTVSWGGVDLFFCISGFVIARSLSNPAPGMGLRDFAFPFWIKRIWRIWPAAIFWVVTATLMSKGFNHFGAFGNFVPNVHDTVATLLQVANFHYISCYTFGVGQCGNEVIYWSLSLGEQFYLLLPLLLFFFPVKKIQCGLAALIAVSFFIPRAIATPFWFVRLDAIAYGVLIAFTMDAAFRQRFMPSFMNNRVTGLAVTLALIAGVCIVPAGHIPVIGTGLLAMICAAMVFIASYDKDWILPIPYLRPLLLYIGSRSFAIYLVHNPSFWITRELFGRFNPGVKLDASYTAPFLALGIALIFILAELTYRVIERPMREKGRRIAHAYRAPVRDGSMMMQLEPVRQCIDM